MQFQTCRLHYGSLPTGIARVPISAKTLIERDMLFRGLPQATLERIAALGLRRVFEEGHVVFMRGDPGDCLCGVITGRIRISVSRPGGKEVFLNIMGPGDSFGEIALLDGNARTATATAIARSELLVIRRNDFLPLLHTEPQLAAHVIQLLCKRVRWTAQLMEDSALLSVPASLAKRLLGLASPQGHEAHGAVKLSLSQEELAQFLGVSRQMVNQYLQAWKAKGWVLLGRGSLTICDQDALAKLARDT